MSCENMKKEIAASITKQKHSEEQIKSLNAQLATHGVQSVTSKITKTRPTKSVEFLQTVEDSQDRNPAELATMAEIMLNGFETAGSPVQSGENVDVGYDADLTVAGLFPSTPGQTNNESIRVMTTPTRCQSDDDLNDMMSMPHDNHLKGNRVSEIKDSQAQQEPHVYFDEDSERHTRTDHEPSREGDTRSLTRTQGEHKGPRMIFAAAPNTAVTRVSKDPPGQKKRSALAAGLTGPELVTSRQRSSRSASRAKGAGVEDLQAPRHNPPVPARARKLTGKGPSRGEFCDMIIGSLNMNTDLFSRGQDEQTFRSRAREARDGMIALTDLAPLCW